ncbi:glycerol-3-phosphate 1-O-acyltransferase PlsY [Pelagibacterium sp. 26DY04]|uniref:glycerol-3-phosphate 1-O-acyltransferase PlsY n=1 Tax=Pelagibacterium sp. 26DY04 TaxID=2967130 RepID=UPI0028162175|nr:glycerol-3-phosphate 1-O-acyltransferase PlsY [Pelagibacterium sp. 26DY04]WMT85351.1 glycerol-3-phosphate 1-O-acyltransferase PlsY [Pelagibacterium sp. 26DY04]
MIEYALALVVGYLLGSIPFGVIATRLAGLGDVRSIGSGNIGATNVLRTGRRDLAALTLICDAGKGAAAVAIAGWLWGYEAALYAGVAAFLGHIFPIWLGFKGGKGVATYIGILLALHWVIGLIFCAVWLLIAFAQRYSSLAALTAAATAPMFAFAFSGVQLTWATFALSIMLFITHRENIRRLLTGTESKIGEKKTPGQA